MPLNSDQSAKVKSFLSSLVLGTADLGFASLPLVDLYKQAKKEGVSFADLVVSDPKALEGILGAVQRQADQLPPVALSIIKGIVEQAQAKKK